MALVVGIQFKQNGKVYYFDPSGCELENGAWAVVETVRGQECGEVVSGPRVVPDGEIPSPLKPILRAATREELDRMAANRARLDQVFAVGEERIGVHGLDMKLVDVEFSFDGKLLFYFTSEGRVDFRNLVRDLASIFHTRIELRQIGVRDEARMLGGLGPCGRGVCCREFLSNFQPVSIRMAKEQSLSLNPIKISGLCGRLMCCLKYEQDTYEQTRKRSPKPGREVMTPEGVGIVGDVNILKETVAVRLTASDGTVESKSFPLDHIGPPGKPLPDEVMRLIADRKAENAAPPEPHQEPARRKRAAPPRAAEEEAPDPPAVPPRAGRAQGKPKVAPRPHPPKPDEADKPSRAVKPWRPRNDAKPGDLPARRQEERPQARQGDGPAPRRSPPRRRGKPGRGSGPRPQPSDEE